MAFARGHGFCYQTFIAWQRKRREQACLQTARHALLAALALLENPSTDPELAAIDLRDALDALGEISGRVDTEDLLGEIFSRFCIGK